MPGPWSYEITIPGRGRFEVTSPSELTDQQAYQAALSQAMQDAKPEEKSLPRQLLEGSMAGFIQSGPIGFPLGFLGAIADRSQKELDKYAYGAGGAMTDVLAGKVSPELAAGAGFATNIATQAIPMVASGQAAKSLAPMIGTGARKLMQSAVKPTIADLKSGKAARAIDTLLEEGISPTQSGVEKLRGLVSQLGDEVKDAIAASNAMIRKGDVGKRLLETYKKFQQQVNPAADLEAIKQAWLEFRSHPLLVGKQDIPVQLAQKLKSGTYQQLGGKAYGEIKTAEMEAQKALARGLREEIATAVPGVVKPLKREAELLNALSVAERRALMEANKNPAGLAWLSQQPGAWAAFMADRSSAFKALIARLLYSGKEQIAGTGGRIGAALAVLPEGQP